MLIARLMKQKIFIFLVFFYVIVFFSCKPNVQSNASQKDRELATIDSLLRDAAFAQSVAETLDSSYYAGIGEKAPPFLSPGDDTAFTLKNKFDEKVATNLAGFYALECGVGLLSAQSQTAPVTILKKITNGTADSNMILLLNRFANATWKASQPFRGVE